MKRITALLAALLLLLSLSPAALAAEDETVSIADADAFLRFAKACEQESYSAGRVFELTADIDLSGTDFSPVPYFAGTFHGNGHRITGLSVTAEGSRLGLFRRVGEGAEILELTVRGSVRPGGTQVNIGGIAGENGGAIVSCTFEGTVAGIENVGGITGRNTGSGRVSGCSFSGAVTGEHQVGGIAGKNEGSVSASTNSGSINTVPVTPVGELRFDLSAVHQDDFLNLANIGGIAGENTGVLSSCTNKGEVGYKYNAYNVGGIAGKSSGFVTACVNNNLVTGRRDVGGVVGQLIPYAVWDLSNGRLDELAGQIAGMQSLLQNISMDARNLSADLAAELELMNAYTMDAITALEELLRGYGQNDGQVFDGIGFDSETGEVWFSGVGAGGIVPGGDTSALSEALANMYAESVAISQLAGAGVTIVADDLSRVSEQMSAIFSSLYNTVSSIGGITGETYDLSLSEAYAHDVGAVASCRSNGNVEAENHAGGIVGTVAFEVDFDMEDRLNASDFLLSNARRYLFAAVRSCASYGSVVVKEEGAGCVAGVMEIGAAVDCVGLGEARSLGGDYVGGIVGRSKGSVSGCWSRAVLSGTKYIGGIAGLGTDLLSSRSWAHIESGREYRGAVAGWTEGLVAENLYVPDAPAGVDGVSLTGQTKPVTAEELLALEGAPKGIDQVTVTFVLPDRAVRRVELPFGGSLEALPEVPNKDGAFWKWDAFDTEHIYYSRRVEGKYYAPGSTLSTGEDVPAFLVEGVFYEGQYLSAAPFRTELPEEEVIRTATLTVNDYDDALTVRMQAPEDGILYSVGADGQLEKLSYTRDGSYIVFRLDNGGSLVYARRGEAGRPALPLPVIAGGAGLLVLIAVLLLARRGKKKKSGGQDPETAAETPQEPAAAAEDAAAPEAESEKTEE